MDILVGLFLFILFIILGSYYFLEDFKKIAELKKFRKRFKNFDVNITLQESINILRKIELSKSPILNKILSYIPFIHQFYSYTEKAKINYNFDIFILFIFGMGCVGLFTGTLMHKGIVFAIFLSLIFTILPIFFVLIKKNIRMKKFERQFYEAMEMVARALRAGHSFTGGIKMVADEFEDPIGTEFNKTLDEANFGVGMIDALNNLCKRVDSPDLKFFVIAVNLQRELGGNLAESLEKIAHLLRERFKLRSRIKALSAEGMLSAIILIALPFVVAFAIFILNPDYLLVLITERIGRIMTLLALLFMGAGIFIMLKMIRIKG